MRAHAVADVSASDRCAVQLPGLGRVLDRELVEAAVSLVTEDAMVKQVLVTERGVRCVVRGARAKSSTYRVTRRVDLSEARVTAEDLLQVVTMLDDLCDQVAGSAARRPVGVSEAESL